jgi:hypothetical protein
MISLRVEVLYPLLTHLLKLVKKLKYTGENEDAKQNLIQFVNNLLLKLLLLTINHGRCGLSGIKIDYRLKNNHTNIGVYTEIRNSAIPQNLVFPAMICAMSEFSRFCISIYTCTPCTLCSIAQWLVVANQAYKDAAEKRHLVGTFTVCHDQNDPKKQFILLHL